MAQRCGAKGAGVLMVQVLKVLCSLSAIRSLPTRFTFCCEHDLTSD